MFCDKCKQEYSLDEMIVSSSNNQNQENNICIECHNKEFSKLLGILLDPVWVKYINITDPIGNVHRFNITRILYPTGIGLYARAAKENGRRGYKFAVFHNHEVNQKQLLKELTNKIKKNVSVKNIKEINIGGSIYKSIENNTVIGRIESNLSLDQIPLLVIDGKQYKWEELGQLLMGFEGFQFKLQILDITDDF